LVFLKASSGEEMENWRSVAVTAEQMAAIDALAEEKYGVQLIQMMENAGRQLASFAVTMLGGKVMGREILVLCGPGNNGGGGMVAARHLHNWGADAQVVLAGDPDRLKGVPAQQWRTITALGLVSRQDIPAMPSIIIDALLGYGGSGDPRPPVSTWIEWANNSSVRVLSLDLPSGLDASSGKPGTPCIRAEATLTLAAPKTGLLTDAAKDYVGELYLADIGIPPEIFPELFPDRSWERLTLSNSILKISE
jgi:NAD(P)H-hydrate epimerase